jgi:general secretion pathway protein H
VSRVRGFTLIELLVVLVIIGVVVGATLFTVRAGGEQRVARDEVRRVQHIVEALRDESVYGMRELGLQFRRSGYRVLAWDGADWIPHEPSRILREHDWPDAVQPDLSVEGMAQVLSSNWPSSEQRPDVVFLSSGEVSAFELEITAVDGTGLSLVVGADGTTRTEPIGMPR